LMLLKIITKILWIGVKDNKIYNPMSLIKKIKIRFKILINIDIILYLNY
jgi:hypothetical protein